MATAELVSDLIEAGKQLIAKVLRTASIPGLFLRQIAVVRPNDELVTALRKAISTGLTLASIRLTNSAVDNILVEDAYIYRST